MHMCLIIFIQWNKHRVTVCAYCDNRLYCIHMSNNDLPFSIKVVGHSICGVYLWGNNKEPLLLQESEWRVVTTVLTATSSLAEVGSYFWSEPRQEENQSLAAAIYTVILFGQLVASTWRQLWFSGKCTSFIVRAVFLQSPPLLEWIWISYWDTLCCHLGPRYFCCLLC